jgi:hypothetical protein
LIGGLVEHRAAGGDRASAGLDHVLDVHQRDRRRFAEAAAGQTKNDHRTVAFEF